MFIKLFYTLRAYDVPVSTRELLDLHALLSRGAITPANYSREALYQLIKLCMIKDERHFDKFDRAMADYFEGVDSLDVDALMNKLSQIPKDWLTLELDPKNLSEKERRLLDKYDSLEALMAALQKRLQEQKKRHQGGSKWIGTGGTSPFGAGGDHPEGVRVGGQSRNRSAAKVWEQRKYRNLDDNKLLGTRQLQLALRNLRQFARTGSDDELNIAATIKRTAQKGMLDIQMQPERRNRVKVLMLFDIGGSMDVHVDALEALFSAAKNEFKTLEFFYFHNCLYDFVWKNNARRHSQRTLTSDLLATYGREYRIIFVGDAAMSPYELLSVGGSVEYANKEAGIVWLKRVLEHFDKVAWLNPQPTEHWRYTHTVGEIQKLFADHMYPMTLSGVENMTAHLAR